MESECCPECGVKDGWVQTREFELVCQECGCIPADDNMLVGRHNIHAKGNTIFDVLDDDNAQISRVKKRKRDSEPGEEDGCLPLILEEEDDYYAKRRKEDKELDGDETTYQRIFHFNERLTQLNISEPGIPLELFNLLVQRYWTKLCYDKENTPLPDQLTKEDIKRLCAETIVPDDLKEKYRSKKFRKNAHHDMRRYAEKWISIRARLGGYTAPSLTDEQLREIRGLFMEAEKAFKVIRHNGGCDGKNRHCHKGPTRCRHNFLNYNYVLVQLLRKMGIADIYIPWLPQLKTTDKLEELNHYWQRMALHMGWEFEKIVTNEYEYKTEDRAVIVPSRQQFELETDIPLEKQDEMVRIWVRSLRGRHFRYKSMDDKTPIPEEDTP